MRQAIFHSKLVDMKEDVDVTSKEMEEVDDHRRGRLRPYIFIPFCSYPSETKIMSELLDYLNINLLLMSKNLYEDTFEIVLEELWFSVSGCK